MNISNRRDIEQDFELSPCYFLSFSEDGLITRINDLFLNDLGYLREEVVNSKKISDLLTIGSKIFFQTHFYPLIKLHGKGNEIFLSFRTSKQIELPVLLNIKLEETESRIEIHCGGMGIINRSRFEKEIIDARNIAEKALVENEILVKLKEELNQNQLLLETRMRMLAHHNKENQQINAVITHDLQEPLRKVSLFSYKILEEQQQTLDTEVIEYLQKIISASEKMSKLILSLQEYLSYNLMPVQISQIKPASIIAESKALYGITEKPLASRFFMEDIPDHFIEGDRNLLIILFNHLFDNSYKFRNPAKEYLDIYISAEIIDQNVFKEVDNRYQYKEYLRICYTDNGIGFDNKYAELIFELFRKAHISDGLGLGLASCRKIMDMHHGSITAQSDCGNSATFTITIPLLHQQ